MRATYKIAMAAGQDAGNASAKRGGRAAWSRADFEVAAAATSRILATIE